MFVYTTTRCQCDSIFFQPPWRTLHRAVLGRLYPPINSLPADILGDIFSFTLPILSPFSLPVPLLQPTVRHSRRGGHWALDAPWSLTAVCSDWRRLALSLPTLWSTMLVSSGMILREEHFLRLQLSRTKDAPLHLIFRFTSSCRLIRGLRFGPLVKEFVARGNRWRMVELCFDSPFELTELFPNLPQPEQLVELKITGEGLDYLRAVHIFEHAPRLTRVLLGDLNRRVGPANVKLPWQNITTYKATTKDEATHLTRIALCATSVEVVDIEVFPRPPSQTHGNHTIIELPSLRRLVLQYPPFISNLCAPNLRELYISELTDDALAPIHSFFARSQCAAQLTTLTIRSCTSSATGLHGILEQTPNLTTLQIGFEPSLGTNTRVTPHQNDILRLLTDSCPKLTAFGWADFDDMTDRVLLVDCIAQRLDSLRSVEIFTTRLQMKTQGRRLRALVDGAVIMNSRKGKKIVDGWRQYS
ncbi:hypothetical protein C8F01DRAFT_1342421 [Mycena amicta]|nr:hypothetical protein C8F01DRAFT_1342421 [Mycena amicta]